MRFLAILLCIGLAGCCGMSSPFGARQAVPAAQATTATHAGCTFTSGLQCNGKSFMGLRFDFPDITGLLERAGVNPFSARSEDPCDRQ